MTCFLVSISCAITGLLLIALYRLSQKFRREEYSITQIESDDGCTPNNKEAMKDE